MNYLKIGLLLFILFPITTSAQNDCEAQLEAQEYKYVSEIFELHRKHQVELGKKENQLRMMTLEQQMEKERVAKSKFAGIAIGKFIGGLFFMTTVLFLILFLIKNGQLKRLKKGY